jgi:beta-phosphoglucomutase-like phosphatase (HAD superfamily)
MMSGISKQNCVIIEDSDNGIDAANSAGIFVFGYKNPLAADQTLEKADLIIDDLREVENYI